MQEGRANASSLETGLSRVKAQAQRIGRIRSEYFKLNSPWKARIEKVNLSAFFQELLLESSRGVHIELLDERLWKVDSASLDRTGLRACLEVLLGNATDPLADMPSPHIALTLREASSAESEMASRPESILAIDVEDNGPGIPAAIKESLFQVVKSVKTKGLGFGLSFCRHVAISIGGAVYFHSQCTSGAKFTLLVPYKQMA